MEKYVQHHGKKEVISLLLNQMRADLTSRRITKNFHYFNTELMIKINEKL
jgi:hypothetical protein